jgi:hypothetical protein
MKCTVKGSCARVYGNGIFRAGELGKVVLKLGNHRSLRQLARLEYPINCIDFVALDNRRGNVDHTNLLA